MLVSQNILFLAWRVFLGYWSLFPYILFQNIFTYYFNMDYWYFDNMYTRNDIFIWTILEDDMANLKVYIMYCVGGRGLESSLHQSSDD